MRFQGSTFPLRGQALARRSGSLCSPLTLPGSFRSAPVWFLLPVPGPGALLGPSSQRSAQPTSLSQQGAQDPAGPQAPHGDCCRVPRAATHGDCTIRWWRWGWRRSLLTLQDLSLASGPSWWGFWSPAGHSHQSALGPLVHPPAEIGESLGEGSICLSPHSPPCWQSGTSNHCVKDRVLTVYLPCPDYKVTLWASY